MGMIDLKDTRIKCLEAFLYGCVENAAYWQSQPIVDLKAYSQAVEQIRWARTLLRDLRKDRLITKK